MADEFQAGVCAENWWMNPYQSNFGSSICSPLINNIDMFSWPNDLDLKARASTNDQSGSGSANNSEESIVFQDTQKPLNQDLSVTSALEMMNNGLSSSITTGWNQANLFHESKRNECNYQGNLQDSLNQSSNHQQAAGVDHFSQIKKDWSPEKLSALDEVTSLDAYKGPTNHGFPVNSSLYGYTSSLIQTLFDTDSDQDSIFGNRSMNYPDISTLCQEKFDGLPPSSSLLLKPTSPVVPKQQPSSHLNIPDNSPWIASNNGLFAPLQSQFLPPKFEEKLNYPNISVKPKNERIRDVSTVVKNSSSMEPVFKRPRIETPSALPTFKVRKEKLGDRVTALQQLVSPFGKTDTASVLHEAIEYIKLLHDQVTVLMKRGSPIQHEQTTLRDPKRTDQELRSRGLCLVPVSSTFPVASETTADFWTPTFGGNFR